MFDLLKCIWLHRPDVYQMRVLKSYEEGQNYVYTRSMGWPRIFSGRRRIATRMKFLLKVRHDELSIQGAGIQFYFSTYWETKVVDSSKRNIKFQKMIDCTEPVYFAGVETRDPATGKSSQICNLMQVFTAWKRYYLELNLRTVMFGKTNKMEEMDVTWIKQCLISEIKIQELENKWKCSTLLTYNKSSLCWFRRFGHLNHQKVLDFRST
jgi:hypothetical protein